MFKICGSVLTISALAIASLYYLASKFVGTDLTIVAIPVLIVWGLLLAWSIAYFKAKHSSDGFHYNPFTTAEPACVPQLRQPLSAPADHVENVLKKFEAAKNHKRPGKRRKG